MPAREMPDGRLDLIDGHLRPETTPSAMVPVLILDVSEEEADKVLLTQDPLAGMAESDTGRLQALLNNVRTDSKAVEQLLPDCQRFTCSGRNIRDVRMRAFPRPRHSLRGAACYATVAGGPSLAGSSKPSDARASPSNTTHPG